MMINIRSLFSYYLLLLLSLNKAFAIIVLTGPEMGETYTAEGGEIEIPISWQDDGTDPTLNKISSYTFLLCTGPNNQIHGLQQLAKIKASELSTHGFIAQFDADIAASGSFYVQVFCELDNGGFIIRYTNRVNLKGMTGKVAPSGSGPSPYGQDSNIGSGEDISTLSTVPYTAQTGKTRFAPMQMQPGSTITVSTWSRRFPTSAVTYYTTANPSPNVLSTITPGWSYTMSSLINFATPAPFPSEVGWYPASVRLQSASLDPNLGESESKKKQKRRRWAD